MATARDLEDDRGVYCRCVLRRRVTLPPRLHNKHARESIERLLRASIEGRCGADGFVRPHSTEILSVSPGRIDLAGLSGAAVYDVTVMADVCNPAVGDVLVCRIENVNTYGVLAVNVSETRVLEVILPRAPVSFEHDVPLDGMEPGGTLALEVMGRQFKLGQRTITLVGKAVPFEDRAPDPPAASSSGKLAAAGSSKLDAGEPLDGDDDDGHDADVNADAADADETDSEADATEDTGSISDLDAGPEVEVEADVEVDVAAEDPDSDEDDGDPSDVESLV